MGLFGNTVKLFLKTEGSSERTGGEVESDVDRGGMLRGHFLLS